MASKVACNLTLSDDEGFRKCMTHAPHELLPFIATRCPLGPPPTRNMLIETLKQYGGTVSVKSLTLRLYPVWVWGSDIKSTRALGYRARALKNRLLFPMLREGILRRTSKHHTLALEYWSLKR